MFIFVRHQIELPIFPATLPILVHVVKNKICHTFLTIHVQSTHIVLILSILPSTLTIPMSNHNSDTNDNSKSYSQKPTSISAGNWLASEKARGVRLLNLLAAIKIKFGHCYYSV